jgi:PhnB protein
MTLRELVPYIHLDGEAAEAIATYERVLGAQLLASSRYAEMPGADFPPEVRERIMHAALRIGSSTLMVSDTAPGMPVLARGGHVQILIDFGDEGSMNEPFAQLAEGGRVVMPLAETFWNATFGVLEDRFGVRWLFHCPK